MLINRIIHKMKVCRAIGLIRKVGVNISIGSQFEIYGPQYIRLGDNVSFGSNLQLQAWSYYQGKPLWNDPVIAIGDNVSFMSNCQISCVDTITIGDGCLFGDNVFITDNFHGKNTANEMDIPPLQRELYSKGGVSIGKNVWVGRNVCIMPGVTICDGAIIGANAVVTHDIPAYSVAAGIPAKVIRVIKEG